MSNASVPLILSFGVIYSIVRCTLEFAMQPIEVRRWKLAQADYWISMFLFEVSILSLAAGSLYRSVETNAYVLIAIIVLLFGSVLIYITGIFLLTPIMIFIRVRQGRLGVVPRIQEAEGWTFLIIVITQFALIAGFGISSLHYKPIMRLWPTPPSATSVIVFIVLVSIAIVSLYIYLFGHSKLFARNHP